MGTLGLTLLGSTRLRSVLVSGMLHLLLLQITVGELVWSHVSLGDHRGRVVRQLLLVVAGRTGHGRIPVLLQAVHRRQAIVTWILLLLLAVDPRSNSDLLGDSRRWRSYGGTLNAWARGDGIRGGNVVVTRG